MMNLFHFSILSSYDEQFRTCDYVCLLWTSSFWSFHAKILVVEETHYVYSTGELRWNCIQWIVTFSPLINFDFSIIKELRSWSCLWIGCYIFNQNIKVMKHVDLFWLYKYLKNCFIHSTGPVWQRRCARCPSNICWLWFPLMDAICPGGVYGQLHGTLRPILRPGLQTQGWYCHQFDGNHHWYYYRYYHY